MIRTVSILTALLAVAMVAGCSHSTPVTPQTAVKPTPSQMDPATLQANIQAIQHAQGMSDTQKAALIARLNNPQSFKQQSFRQ